MTVDLKWGATSSFFVPSPKLIKILKSKTLLSDEEIIPLSDAEAWDKVYEAEAIMRAEREAKRKPEVCFSGFNRKEREMLESLAIEKGFEPKGSVTSRLVYLIIGDTAGESKIAKAEKQGVQILRREDFEQLWNAYYLHRYIKYDWQSI